MYTTASPHAASLAVLMHHQHRRSRGSQDSPFGSQHEAKSLVRASQWSPRALRDEAERTANEESEADEEDGGSGASDEGDEQDRARNIHFAYFASPSRILCSACMKGDYFQAQSAVEMVLKKANSGSMDDDDGDDVDGDHGRYRNGHSGRHTELQKKRSDAIFRLLTTHEARHQMNALHLAVLYDHPALVEYLVRIAKTYCPIELGSNRATQRQNAKAPSKLDEESEEMMSIEGSYVDVVNYRCGDSKHQATPLMLCTSVACAMTLIDHGARLDARNSSGMTALHYASSTGNAGFVSLLIHHGANVNETDSRGATALHWAVFEGFQYTAMLLVGYGASQSLRDWELQTPLMIASAVGDAFLAKQLIIEGAPVNAKDRHGRSALDIAKQSAHFDTVNALKAGACDSLVAWIVRKGGSVVFFWGMIILTQLLSLFFAVSIMPNAVTMLYYSLSICICTCLMYIYVWLKDPGYVPKSKVPAYELLAAECASVPCPTCISPKPLRSKHCSWCRRCVYRFDHHCPWINNCIGIGNHCGFLIFLVILLGYCAFTASLSVMVLMDVYPIHGHAQWPSTRQSIGSFPFPPDWVLHYVAQASTFELRLVHAFLVLSALIFGLPTLVLLCLQLRNVRKNLTTNEVFNKDKYPYLKTPMDEFYNPYDRGCRQNFAEVCLARNTEAHHTEDLYGTLRTSTIADSDATILSGGKR